MKRVRQQLFLSHYNRNMSSSCTEDILVQMHSCLAYYDRRHSQGDTIIFSVYQHKITPAERTTSATSICLDQLQQLTSLSGAVRSTWCYLTPTQAGMRQTYFLMSLLMQPLYQIMALITSQRFKDFAAQLDFTDVTSSPDFSHSNG